MRTYVLLLFIFIGSSVFSQVDQGTNFLNIGGIAFNKETQTLSVFPVFTDTTTGTQYAGKNNYDITLGYRYTLHSSFSLGVESRFLANKLSSYAIHSVGPSFRFHFPIGKLGQPKKRNGSKEEYIEFKHSQAIARNFFFIDYTGLFGEMRFRNEQINYQSNMLQFGVSFRMPASEKRVIRHLGIEFGLGVNYRTTHLGNYSFFPVSQAKLHYYLDRHYTRNSLNR